MEHLIHNPILPGFYPDPSICRVGDDYYMVTSSFELFPGIPVFHSRDLANWEQIGYALNRPDQYYVEANFYSGGGMAPTIRWHKGIFYIINCNFSDADNFIITAEDPAGPWSAPHYLPDVPGIDASIFFDDDDRCYVVSTGDVVDQPDGTKGQGIWMAEFDLEHYRVKGEKWTIWGGALHHAHCPESPHIYHIGRYYYLLSAEGGTEHDHCIVAARSEKLDGSLFTGYTANPILTHRHLSRNYPIDSIGHGDLVQTQSGDWYMVCLGSRSIEGECQNLGRETFIVPVIWQKDWPVCSPDTGKVEWTYPLPEGLSWTPVPAEPGFDDFDAPELALQWSFWGTPHERFWSLSDSQLKLKLLPRPMCRPLRPARFFNRVKVTDDVIGIICRRQRHPSFSAAAKLTFRAETAREAAGLVIMQATYHMFRLEKGMNEAGQQVIRFVRSRTTLKGWPHLPGFESETHEEQAAELPFDGETVILKFIERGEDVGLWFGAPGCDLQPLFLHADASELNRPPEVTNMVGTAVGMYATANGSQSSNEAVFDWFDYEGLND